MKIPKSLEQSIQAAEALLDRRKQIRGGIDSAREQVVQAELALQGAQRANQRAEAAAALEGGPVAASAVKAVATARAGLEAAEARLAGLRQRLVDSDRELSETVERFGAERRAFRSAAVEGFREVYRAAAEQFARVLRHGHGLAAGLGVEFHGLAAVKLHDLEGGTRELVPTFPRTRDASGTWRADWESDSDARRAFDEVAAAKATSDRLAKEVRPLREAAKKAAEAEAQAAVEAARETGPRSSGLTFPPEEQPVIPRVSIRPAAQYPDRPESRYGPTAATQYPDE